MFLLVNYAVAQVLGGSGQFKVGPRLVALGLDALYGAVLIHVWGSTLGMAAVKVRAIDKVTCENLPWGRSWKRAGTATLVVGAVPLIVSLAGVSAISATSGADGSGLAFLIMNVGFFAFLWAKYDALRQTIQDKVADSIVVGRPR